MMTNTFSIFDPTTPMFSSANWLSMIIWMTFVPTTMWYITSRPQKSFNQMSDSMTKEFKPTMKKRISLLLMPMSLFIYVLMNNLPGLMPHIFTASSHLVYSLTLALTLWSAIILYGICYGLKKFLSHLIPQGTPEMLSPFMVLVESISIIIRPLTLSVRLSANMIAGHLLINLLMSVSTKSFTIFSVVLVMPQSALLILELAVTFIQAYVFSVLITLYCAESN